MHPEQENAQPSRWSLNSSPAREFPPLAIANQYPRSANERSEAGEIPSHIGSRVRPSLAEQRSPPRSQNRPCSSTQMDPRSESSVPHAHAADRTPFPTYVCLPSGLYKARTGQVVVQVSTSLMDGGYTRRYQSPTTCHALKRRQSKVSLRLHRHLAQNLPGRRKKTRETSWRQLPRISPRMGQTQGEQQSARANI